MDYKPFTPYATQQKKKPQSYQISHLESSIWNTDGMTSVAFETPLPRSIRDIAPEVPAVVFTESAM
jgi:hypothetical protein